MICNYKTCICSILINVLLPLLEREIQKFGSDKICILMFILIEADHNGVAWNILVEDMTHMKEDATILKSKRQVLYILGKTVGTAMNNLY